MMRGMLVGIPDAVVAVVALALSDGWYIMLVPTG